MNDKMTYKEYVDIRMEGLHALPIKYAFGRKQFKEMMEEWGLTENDTDKIYKLGDTGGFYLKADAEKIRAWFNKEDKLLELMQDKEFRKDAFRYEMDNHEYLINFEGDYEVCKLFVNIEYAEFKDYKDYLKEAGHEDWIPEYTKARNDHIKAFEH